MSEARRLTLNELRWQCDPGHLTCETTDELEDLQQILGQSRALGAVQFGIGIRHDGYNMYVQGPPGLGKRSTVKHFLTEKAATEPTPPDWCYVNNFDQSHKPWVLELPAGRGAKLRDEMANLVEDLKTAIPAALEIEEHQNRLQEIEQDAKQRHEREFKELSARALERGIQLVRTPAGYAMAPVRDNEVLGPEEFEKLDPEERKKIESSVGELQHELKELIEEIPQWRKDIRDKVKELNREAARLAIRHLLSQLRQGYQDLAAVLEYLDAVQKDIIEHADDFQPQEETAASMLGIPISPESSFHRYAVNLLVDNSSTTGAPVIFEDHPSYQNLLGRVEHESRMGTLVTQFTLVKPGAMHRANGGYLVLDALRVLQQPYAWEGLKRALHARELKIESLGEALSLVSTISLEPQPIPLDVKVILVGNRSLYYLLYQYDADFAELFKVSADFDELMDRNEENCRLYVRFIATIVRQENHRPFDKFAVARVIEQSARIAGDAAKLSTSMQSIADLLREADYWASTEKADLVTAEHVQRAVEMQVNRADRVRSRIYEEINRGTILIETSGARVGQVNALSVIDMGNFSFGQPSRITATARIGKGEVIDIEREVDLSGAIHSKGVLILSSFLASRFAQNRPLTLSASLVFEQSYGRVDGDSASVAESCALLSVLAGIPIKQSLAITGSVNQHGVVQAIGGVNQKIEGFFDICRAAGLSGEQGVVIPASNVKHLMLRRDVVDAVAQDQFHVYAVETVDQAVQLLTGIAAGELGPDGTYPEGTVNHRAAARLDELFRLRQKISQEASQKKTDD